MSSGSRKSTKAVSSMRRQHKQLSEENGRSAWERLHPDLPMMAGHVLRREFEYIRHGTLSWFFNLDVVTGQVIEPSGGPTRNEADCLAHLQRLITSDPTATRWHIIADNLNIHQSESLVRWIAERRHPAGSAGDERQERHLAVDGNTCSFSA